MEIIQKPCATCGKPFFKRRRHTIKMWADAKFCSRPCYGKGKKTYQSKVCVRCFKEFEPLGSQQKICLACCNRICPQCGIGFVIVGGQHDRIFCSNRCVGLSQKQENPKYKNREYKLEKTKAYQARHPERVKMTRMAYKKKYPWRHVFRGMIARCENPKSKAWSRYGGRGIRVKMTSEEVRAIWLRDKTHLLKRPTIDRIDNDGHYETGNVRFIEKSENSRKVAIDRRKAKEK